MNGRVKAFGMREESLLLTPVARRTEAHRYGFRKAELLEAEAADHGVELGWFRITSGGLFLAPNGEASHCEPRIGLVEWSASRNHTIQNQWAHVTPEPNLGE
jgi:hypothetical protein